METFLIAFTAAFASLLTFFSGFGLGTILTPVMVLFFPVEIAIAMTGIVHLLNNFFKIGLTWRNINRAVAVRFALTAIPGAFIGAEALQSLASAEPLWTYSLGEQVLKVTAIKLTIAVLMAAFALLEVIPSMKEVRFGGNKIFAGGFVSGFFGGLSGNQGALRSMFLIRAGMTKESFIATGIVIACAVDVTRLSVYYTRFSDIDLAANATLLTIAVLSAFAGAFAGSRLLKKVTLQFLQWTVTVMILGLSVALGAGWI